MRVPVGHNTSIQELAAAINELYDAMQWQDPINNRDLGKIEPTAQFLRTSLLAAADGTNWNPNSHGEGYYRRTSAGAWVKLLETDDAFTTSIDADKLDGHHWSEIPNVALTKYFESTEQTITASGALTIAHGLGVEPKLIQVLIVCKTAEFNYSINDKLFVGIMDDGGTNVQGVSCVMDSTNLNIRFGGGSCYVIQDKTTGGRVGITNANWKIVFRVWA